MKTRYRDGDCGCLNTRAGPLFVCPVCGSSGLKPILVEVNMDRGLHRFLKDIGFHVKGITSDTSKQGRRQFGASQKATGGYREVASEHQGFPERL